MDEVMVPLWVLHDIRKKALETKQHWAHVEEVENEYFLETHARGVQYGVETLLGSINSAIEVFGNEEASAPTETPEEKTPTDSLPECEFCGKTCEKEELNPAFNGCHVDICDACSDNDKEWRRCDECEVLTHVTDLFTTEHGDEVCISCNERYAEGPDEDAIYDSWKQDGGRLAI